MCKRPISTISTEAAGDKEPITTQQMSAAQKARMRARRVSGGRPSRGVGLFCFPSMLPSIGVGEVAYDGERPIWTQMARSTARTSSRDKVANLDLSRRLLTVAIDRKRKSVGQGK